MMSMFDNVTVAVTLSGIEIVALKKLSLVSHVLAQKIGGAGGREQMTLVKTLDDLIRQIESCLSG